MDSMMILITGAVLLLFVWGWIGVVIMNSISLNKRIEKLSSITNPLPEEEKALRHLKDMQSIEQGKVSSAKIVVIFLMLLLVAGIVLAPSWEALSQFFDGAFLVGTVQLFFILLVFFCIPTFVGLSLAGSSDQNENNNENVETVTVNDKTGEKTA